MFFGFALLVGGRRVVSWRRFIKSYLGPADISSFSSQDLIRRNKHHWLWLVVLTGYFYILFLWGIVVSDLPPLQINEYLVLPLSGIAFTTNSQADNHFYKYIFLFLLFQILNSNCLQKKLKMVYMVYFKWFTEKALYKKNSFFSVNYVKISELHVVHTWSHMQSE